ncbi:MAG: DUF1501 domain-containing protein [Planctomycetaceae bacterium]|nr:DUF1501 domain-containing protein [Planctomycetaceae bacterium]
MFQSWHEDVRLSRRSLSRRGFVHAVSASAFAAGTLSFRDVVTVQADELRQQGRAMILLWMQGGPSQFETFDPKPGHENGGPTKAIDTAVSGIRIAESWTETAKVTKELAILRSLTNKEGQHDRATYQLHTGYVPSGSVKHPALGSNIAHQIAPGDVEIPSVVAIGGGRGGPGFGGSSAGFLGVDYEPFQVAEPSRLPDNVAPGTSESRYRRRLGLLGQIEQEVAQRGGEVVVDNHRKIYDKASKLVLSPKTKAFDLSQESAAMRAKYGDSNFSQGCLLARRLVEAGVTFVEVRHGNWDTHDDNFDRVANLSKEVDQGFAALVSDLKERGLIETTLIAWMGEFGRTPRVNPRGGRDHYPRAFSAVLAGGGVKGGQVIGATSADGTAVDKDPITVPDLFCSICRSLGVNPQTENMSPLGRPMKIVDGGEVVEKLFA